MGSLSKEAHCEGVAAISGTDDYEEFYKGVLAKIQSQKERQERTLTKEEAALDVPYIYEPCEKYLGELVPLIIKRAYQVFILGLKIYGPIHALPVLIFKRNQLRNKYVTVFAQN